LIVTKIVELANAGRRGDDLTAETLRVFEAIEPKQRRPASSLASSVKATSDVVARRNHASLPTFRLMRKIEDYLNHAEECRGMARRAQSPEHREMLLNMARTWDDLSAHRTEQIARQKRIDAILRAKDTDPC
jgi:hypothetical protein